MLNARFLLIARLNTIVIVMRAYWAWPRRSIETRTLCLNNMYNTVKTTRWEKNNVIVCLGFHPWCIKCGDIMSHVQTQIEYGTPKMHFKRKKTVLCAHVWVLLTDLLYGEISCLLCPMRLECVSVCSSSVSTHIVPLRTFFFSIIRHKCYK